MSNLDPSCALIGVSTGDALALAWNSLPVRPLAASAVAGTLALTGCGRGAAQTVEWPAVAAPPKYTLEEARANLDLRPALTSATCSHVVARKMGTTVAIFASIDGDHPQPIGASMEIALDADGENTPPVQADSLKATVFARGTSFVSFARVSISYPYVTPGSRTVKISTLGCPSAAIKDRELSFSWPTDDSPQLRLDDTPPPTPTLPPTPPPTRKKK